MHLCLYVLTPPKRRTKPFSQLGSAGIRIRLCRHQVILKFIQPILLCLPPVVPVNKLVLVKGVNRTVVISDLVDSVLLTGSVQLLV